MFVRLKNLWLHFVLHYNACCCCCMAIFVVVAVAICVILIIELLLVRKFDLLNILALRDSSPIIYMHEY